MSERYAAVVRFLRDAVLGAAGTTDPSLRAAVEQYAANAGGGSRTGTAVVPPVLGPYVDKVARHAYRVTESDVDALRKAGYSEDAIFDLTASAAVGAGMGRLERGLAALKGER
jgi:alkylhydroperoxidase family enzyme